MTEETARTIRASNHRGGLQWVKTVFQLQSGGNTQLNHSDSRPKRLPVLLVWGDYD